MCVPVPALPKNPSTDVLEGARSRILDALRTPSTRPRIRSALFKTYANARKNGKLDGIDLQDLSVASPEVTANLNKIVKDLTTMERILFENDLLFGTSPVIARDARRVRTRDAAKEE